MANNRAVARNAVTANALISCHVLWIMCLLVSSFWEGSSSLMEARDGSLESVFKTLSIMPHLLLEWTVPLNQVLKREKIST